MAILAGTYELRIKLAVANILDDDNIDEINRIVGEALSIVINRRLAADYETDGTTWAAELLPRQPAPEDPHG